MMQDDMANVHASRKPIGVKQWKHELELLRSEIGHQHDDVLERMRADETRLLEALYSVSESQRGQMAARAWCDRTGPELARRPGTRIANNRSLAE
jgi:hypothetical protein